MVPTPSVTPLGEFDLIAAYFQSRAGQVSQGLGIGDDAALLTPPPGQQLVISTDTLVAGRHFPLTTDAFSIGWKSLAVNLSDLAAMGAEATSFLLALSLPQQDSEWLEAFSQGLFALANQTGVQLIGGDTTRSPVLSLTITALGWVPAGQAVCRQGMQPGDLLVVSGTPGDAAYALKHPGSPLQSRLDRPEPRLGLGQRLRGHASSMLDISDGLAQDLSHLLRASGTGAVIELAKLPFSPILMALPETERWAYALQGGDDYELCFSLPAVHWPAVCRESPVPLTVIGYSTAEPGLVLHHHGLPVSLPTRGYQHFDSAD